MSPKLKKEILRFIKGFLIASCIGIASKLVVMAVFSEVVLSWIAFIFSLIAAALPAGYYSAKAQGD